MSQDWAAKIRKLLDTASHPNTDPVLAETYREKALELAAQWEIDVAQLLATQPTRSYEFGVVQVRMEGVPKIYWRAAGLALTHVIDALGGMGFTYDKTPRLGIVCDGHDADRIVTLFHLITTQMITEFNVWSTSPATRAKLNGRTASEKFHVRKSFFPGFGRRVEQRINAFRSDGVKSAPGAELVMIAKNDGARAYANEHMKFKTVTTGSLFQSGYQAGDAAGQRADVGGVKVNASGAEPMLPLGG